MKKTIILLIVLMVISVGFLSGCNESEGDSQSSEENRFVGTWKTNNVYMTLGTTMTFFSDGTCSYVLAPNYEVKDEKLVFFMHPDGDKIQYFYDYSFSDNDTKLTLTSVYTAISDIYTKQ